jgi:hypothetical protein
MSPSGFPRRSHKPDGNIGFHRETLHPYAALAIRRTARMFPVLFFDWFRAQSNQRCLRALFLDFPTLGVFWIRLLVGVRCCRSRVKFSRKSHFKKITGNNEEMPLAA